MAWLLRMPEVAANATEAVLQEWQVQENVSFTAESVLATVETDKAVVDIEAETDGVLLRRLATDGTKVEVGAPIAVVAAADEDVDDLDAVLATLGVAAGGGADAPSGGPPVGSGGSTDETVLTGAEDGVPQPEEPEPAVEQPVLAPVVEPDGSSGGSQTKSPSLESAGTDASGAGGLGGLGGSGRIFSSPLARRLASDAGLDLAALSGTGPNRRVLRRDVEAALGAREEAAAAAPAPARVEPTREPSRPAAAPGPRAAVAVSPGAPGTEAEQVPHSRMRRAIAARLVESKQTVPHFYLRATLEVGDLLDLRNRLNEGATTKISVNDLVVKAAAEAQRLVPEMNVVWTEQAVRRFEHADIAVAVATEGGLLTPVVHGVEEMAVGALARCTRDLAARAKSGQLRQDELEGGALCVTNLGMFGTEEFAAIINPPQAAILAVGAARQEPVVRDGGLSVGTVMKVTLSVDHRPVDGVVAARWMQAFTGLVQTPLRILA